MEGFPCGKEFPVGRISWLEIFPCENDFKERKIPQWKKILGVKDFRAGKISWRKRSPSEAVVEILTMGRRGKIWST